MQVIGFEAQCGFMPGTSTVNAIFTMRVSVQKRFRRIRGCFLSILLRHLTPFLGRCSSGCLLASDFPLTIVNLVPLFHENVTLEVDLDDDGNTIIRKYTIGVKQRDTLAPVLFLCYIQAVLVTLFPKSEAAGIEKLMFRSMQPKLAVELRLLQCTVGSL
jgi:hypothetical protein